MTSNPGMRLLLLLLVASSFIIACNSDGESDPGAGNVRFVLTSATPAPLAVTAVSGPATPPGGTTALAGGVLWEDDDDDEGDDNGDDILSKLAQVNVTFSDLLARNLEGDLVDLDIDLPVTVDLIPVVNGQQVTLPAGTLPPGMYDQIIVVIRSVEFVLDDGTRKLLTPPGGGWTRIIPVEVFEVTEGQTITIELKFHPERAFGELGGEFEFSPEFECERRD